MKNKLILNMFIDLALLISTAALSFTGFIIKVILPSRHAIRHEGIEPWLQNLGGLGRHDWGDLHLWIGFIWGILLIVHLLMHIKMVKAFIYKQYALTTARKFLLLVIILLILITVLPWLYLLF